MIMARIVTQFSCIGESTFAEKWEERLAYTLLRVSHSRHLLQIETVHLECAMDTAVYSTQFSG